MNYRSDISKITIPSGTYNLKDETARNSLSNYLPKTGGELTGQIIEKAGSVVYSANGTSGSYNVVNIATITINDHNCNSPIEIAFCRRNDNIITRLYIKFSNANNKDPSLQSFTSIGDHTNAYLAKSNTSTWDLYIVKTDAYDTIDIVDYHLPTYDADKITLVWKNNQVKNLPPRCTQVLLGGKIYYSVSASQDVNGRYITTTYIKDLNISGPQQLTLTKGNGNQTKIRMNRHIAKIFKKVVCCGDGHTAGYMMDSTGTAHLSNKEFSWTHYMGDSTGNQWINCGVSDTNVLTYQTDTNGLQKAISCGKAQAYIIGLGFNDAEPSTDTTHHVDIGTSNDIGTNNTTYYAGLSKIIRDLHSVNTSAKIFVQTIPSTKSKYTDYNTAIRTICTAYKDSYNVHLLDLYNYIDLYQDNILTNDMLSNHYTAIGYQQIAENLEYILSDYISNNISDFQDVAFIPYDCNEKIISQTGEQCDAISMKTSDLYFIEIEENNTTPMKTSDLYFIPQEGGLNNVEDD